MTISLLEYLELKLRHHPYAIIDDDERARLLVEPNYATLCHIENDVKAVSYLEGNSLPELRTGLWRLWWRKDWDISENHRIATAQKIVDMQGAWTRKVEAVIYDFVAKGIAEVIARQMVGTLPHTTIEVMWQALQVKG